MKSRELLSDLACACLLVVAWASIVTLFLI